MAHLPFFGCWGAPPTDHRCCSHTSMFRPGNSQISSGVLVSLVDLVFRDTSSVTHSDDLQVFWPPKPLKPDRRSRPSRPCRCVLLAWLVRSAVPLSVRAPLVSDAQALTCISPLIYHQLLFSQLVHCPLHRFACVDSVCHPFSRPCSSASPVPIGVCANDR